MKSERDGVNISGKQKLFVLNDLQPRKVDSTGSEKMFFQGGTAQTTNDITEYYISN